MWKNSGKSEMANEIKDRISLGKGEVVSSILPGSTTKRDEYAAFLSRLADRLATQYATKHEHDASIRGKSVEFVRGAFR